MHRWSHPPPVIQSISDTSYQQKKRHDSLSLVYRLYIQEKKRVGMASRLYKHREIRGELLITVALRYTFHRFEIQTSLWRFEGVLLRFEQAFNDSRLFESQKHPLESTKACLNLESTKCVPRGHHRIYYVDHTISTRPPTFNTSSWFMV